MHRYAALSVCLILIGTGVAAAQTAQPGLGNPGNAAPRAPCTPGAGSGGTVGSADSSQTLSDKLANSNGVICPPTNVDPEMQKPAPGGGRMKVIPPPGAPGGDPGTVPK